MKTQRSRGKRMVGVVTLMLAACCYICATERAPAQEEAQNANATGPSVPVASSTEGPAEEQTADPAVDGAEAATQQRLRVSLVRPVMTDEQRADWAERLRKIYGQPSNLWPPPLVDASVEWKEIGLLPDVPQPEENAYSPAKAKLGMKLFFDPRLSGSGQIACASCHDPDLSWADGRTTAIGNRRKVLKRNAPSILNAGFSKSHFWDGRAASLEDQATAVLLNPDEMDSSDEHIHQEIGEIAEYKAEFKEAFGDESISMANAVRAIACFERTIVGGQSAFDQFLRGRTDALSDEAIIGLHLFRTEAHCMNCHHGPNFSDDQFHDLGLSYYGRSLQDLGRYEISRRPEDVGRFKTPTLRNVARTAPYMHIGLFPLDGVLNLYNAGMPTLRRKEHQADDELFPTKSPLLSPLYLNRQDLAALKSFLESLSEPPRRIRPPVLPGID